MPKIDFHTHFVEPTVMRESAPRGVLSGFGARPFEPPPAGSPRAAQTAKMLDPEMVLADLAERGMDAHVLSASTVVQGTG